MTLEAWVDPTALDALADGAASRSRPAASPTALYANTDTNRPSAPRLHRRRARHARERRSSRSNTWTHLAATYDGATLRLYVNGTQVASQASRGTIVSSTGALRIGGNGVWPSGSRACIDEVRVYNRALTAAEIQADMNLAVKPPTP